MKSYAAANKTAKQKTDKQNLADRIFPKNKNPRLIWGGLFLRQMKNKRYFPSENKFTDCMKINTIKFLKTTIYVYPKKDAPKRRVPQMVKWKQTEG